MTDATPARRVLPARNRRESAAARRASSPLKPVPVTATSTPATPASSESKAKRRPEKRTKVVHVSTPARSTSTPTSTGDEFLPTKLSATKPLPTSIEKQNDHVSNKLYQNLADSAILAASLHRSRIQWLCDGIFKKYWTKPIKRKKAPVEEPPNNPDVKSMQKLGTGTVTIEPHTFDVTFYIVREAPVQIPPVYRLPQQTPQQTPSKPPQTSAQSTTTQPAVHAPVVMNVPSAPTPVSTPVPTTAPAPAASTIRPPIPSPSPAPNPAPAPAPASKTTPTPSSTRLPTPPGGAKTTDPVIQMLASRAATDNHLKELMKVVATSRATPDQLREFQAHIDEFNAIVKRQQAEKDTKAKPTPKPAPQRPVASHPHSYNSIHRSSPLNPVLSATPSYTTYPTQPRPEPAIKHVVMEITSAPSATTAPNPDRWLFPEYAVLDTQYGGTEMTCSFLVERNGSAVLSAMQHLTDEEMRIASARWKANVDYFQPVTMIVHTPQSRTIATIAGSAKALPDVRKYMEDVMERKTRAPAEYLVFRLPKDKPDSSADFVDSAVELSGEDDDLKDVYPL